MNADVIVGLALAIACALWIILGVAFCAAADRGDAALASLDDEDWDSDTPIYDALAFERVTAERIDPAEFNEWLRRQA